MAKKTPLSLRAAVYLGWVASPPGVCVVSEVVLVQGEGQTVLGQVAPHSLAALRHHT